MKRSREHREAGYTGIYSTEPYIRQRHISDRGIYPTQAYIRHRHIYDTDIYSIQAHIRYRHIYNEEIFQDKDSRKKLAVTQPCIFGIPEYTNEPSHIFAGEFQGKIGDSPAVYSQIRGSPKPILGEPQRRAPRLILGPLRRVGSGGPGQGCCRGGCRGGAAAEVAAAEDIAAETLVGLDF